MQRRLKIPQHIIIVTHTFFYGASEALRDYLVAQKNESLIYLAHPLLSENSNYTVKRFTFGEAMYEKIIKRSVAGSIGSYIRDMWMTFVTCFVFPKHPYVYIGINPLNACVGIVLRACGRVDRVIFYAIDFIPKRSNVAIINYIYHALESFAVTRSDACWNVSPRIEEGRKKYLNLVTSKKKQIVVPIGVWEKDIVLKAKRMNNNRLIFVGHLLKKQGLQEVIRALPRVIKKVPHVSLAIIGGGEYEKSLRDLVEELSLGVYVTFLGWESNQKAIKKHIMKSDLALATYEPSGKDTTNFSYYADPTKIKTYLSCGVPILMSDVSYNAKILMGAGVAVVVPYEIQAIASAIIRLFTHTNTLYTMKERSVREAHTFRWDRIFEKAFQSV